MTNSPFILQILIFSILFSTPLLVMLILYLFGRRYLTDIDIELYSGLSGRIILLASLITGGGPFLILSTIPFYGFIAPIEFYVFLTVDFILYDYMGINIGLTIYNILLLLTILSIVTLYVYLIFFGRRFQEKTMKIYYLIVIIIGFIFVIGGLGSRFFAYLGLLQFIFVAATVARWLSRFKRHY